MNQLKQMFAHLSLKTKWTLSTAFVIFFSYSLLCMVIYVALYTWLIHSEESKAIRTVNDVTIFLDSQENTFSIQELQKSIGFIKAIVDQNQTVRIYNLDGYEVLRIHDDSPSAEINASLEQLQNTVITKEKLEGINVLVVQRIVQIGDFTGILQLVHPLNTFHSLMKYILTAMIIAGGGALLIAMSMSHYLANILLKPLKDLRNSMAQVKVDGFQEELHFTYNAQDEIGDLLKIYLSMMEELQISFSKQQQFVSDASHELRTPIQAIEGHLSLIKRWGKDNPQVLEESLDTALDEVNRMKKMIEELLNLARKEVKEDVLSDIEKVMKSVTSELEVIYSNATITIETFGEKRKARITENAFAQIMRNIIENGIRYNDKTPIIQIKIHYFPETIFVSIQDNGMGIDKDHLPHIFDRFYRADPSRSHKGGTGLGLSITKMLADKYQVEIEVTSKMGVGTNFTLLFPINSKTL